jgi:hypothetical protein
MDTCRYALDRLLICGVVLAILAAGTSALADPSVYCDWRLFTTRDGLPDGSVRTVHVDGESVWVGTDDGLALYSAGKWTTWTEQDGLPWPAISAIDVNTDTRDVWLGTWGGGLVRFSAGRFDVFNQFNSGLSGDLVFAVAAERHKTWVSTTGGISSFDTLSGEWELHHQRRADAPEKAFVAILIDRDRARLYAPEWCGLLHAYDLKNRRWSIIDTGSGTRSKPAATTALALDRGRLCLTTRTDLLRRQPDGTWQSQPLGTDADVSASATCLAASATALWIGGLNGVTVYPKSQRGTRLLYRAADATDLGTVALIRDGKAPVSRSLHSPFPEGSVRSVAVQDQTVWIATPGGLARGTNLRPLSTLPPAPPASPDEPARVRRPGSPPTLGPQADAETGKPGTVTIASFGPITKTIALPGAPPGSQLSRPVPDSLAIQIATEQANRVGGFRGEAEFDVDYGSFGYIRYAWGLPEDDLALFARERVPGIVAVIRPQDRVSTAVASRMELPIVNASGAIPTAEEEAAAWIFRCRAHDPRHHHLLIEHLTKTLGHTRFAVLRTGSPLGREHLDLWTHYVKTSPNAAVQLVAELECDPESTTLLAVLDRARRADPQVVLTWTDVSNSLEILRTMRERGMDQLFVGSDRIVCDKFARSAGSSAGSVMAPYPCPHRRNPDEVQRFIDVYTRQRSTAQQHLPPDAHAQRTYDAARHLMFAISLGHLDPASVREVLVSLDHSSISTLRNGNWDRVTP